MFQPAWVASLVLSLLLPVAAAATPTPDAMEAARREASGVCPPFNLLDVRGEIIDPARNLNAQAPYSPKKTCGKCHDYKKITEGYHFQQGRGEKMAPEFAARYPWATSPGQYGGRW